MERSRLKPATAAAVIVSVFAVIPHAAAESPSPVAGPTADVGAIVVRDQVGLADSVDFYFAPATAGAEQRVAAAARAAGLDDRGIDDRSDSDDSGALVLRLSTTIGRDAGFLARRIGGDVLSRLRILPRAYVLLDLHPAAHVSGPVRQVKSGLLSDRYLVTGAGDVTYTIPMAFFVRVAVLLIVLLAAPALVLPRFARRVERSDLDTVEKVHRLRAAMLAIGLLMPLVLLVLLFIGAVVTVPDVLLSEIAPGLTRSAAVSVLLGIVLLLALYVGGTVVTALPVSRAYRRVRGIEMSGRERRRAIRRSLAFFAPLFFWIVFINGARDLLGDSPWRAVVEGVGFVVLLVGGPVLTLLVLRGKPVTGELRERLMAMFRDNGVRLRDVRVMESRAQKLANAFVIGLVPRFRYVVLTDHLVREFEPDEVDAVARTRWGTPSATTCGSSFRWSSAW